MFFNPIAAANRGIFISLLVSSSSESMLVGSASALNDGAFLGVNFSPVKVNAPEPCRKVVSTAIPFGVPSSSGRAISRFSSCRFFRWFA